MFAVFLARYPVRVLTPQIARLRYYACQEGLAGGPLSSSLKTFDWRKAFVWRASDTEYRQRQFSQLFETLTPRLYAHLYYAFGPFMWLPLSLACALLIGFLVAFLVRQWCGDWLPGLAAGGFWLMTTEVLVGHHAPIRYAKDFAALMLLGMISLLVSLKNPCRRRAIWTLAAFLRIWWVGLFTDEYIVFSLPAFLAALFTWPWLKRYRWSLAVILVLLAAVSLGLYVKVMPELISPDFQEPYSLVKLRQWPSPPALLFRNLRYLILNTADVFSYNFGSAPPRSLLQIVGAALAGLTLLALTVSLRAWRGWGRMILFWTILAVCAEGILLPEGKDILHQHTYYNRPLVALLMVILGLFTFRAFSARRSAVLSCWLGALVLAAVLNFHTIATGVTHDPEESYLTRYGLENILQLHDRLRAGELKTPVFVAYPQYRDVVNGVYRELEAALPYTLDEGFPWSLYRSVMPRLYLRHFEERELRVDPRQFVRWASEDEHAYRAAAKYFYDMPAGRAWDLTSVRMEKSPSSAPLVWRRVGDGLERRSELVGDLLGEAPYVSLGEGNWCADIPVLAPNRSWALVFAVRHGGDCSYAVKGAYDRSAAAGECSYRWSFQLFAVQIEEGREIAGLCVAVEDLAEVIGPVVVPAGAVALRPLAGRNYLLPARIPYLEIRGTN